MATTTRWLLGVANDEIEGVDQLVVVSRGLRSARGITLGGDHARGLGMWIRLPEAFVALILGRALAAATVVTLASLDSEREAPGVDRAWRAVLDGRLTGLSARLQGMREEGGVVLAATIAEVSLVVTPAVPTCRVVAAWEGPVAPGTFEQGLKGWAAWRSRHVREVA